MQVDAWLLLRPLVASLGVFLAGVACAALTKRLDARLRAPGDAATADVGAGGGSSGGVGGGGGSGGGGGGGESSGEGARAARLRRWLLSPPATLAATVGLGVLLAWGADAVHATTFTRARSRPDLA